MTNFQPAVSAALKLWTHRAAAAASRSIGKHCDAPKLVPDPFQASWQASPCISMDLDAAATAAAAARCVHTLNSLLKLTFQQLLFYSHFCKNLHENPNLRLLHFEDETGTLCWSVNRNDAPAQFRVCHIVRHVLALFPVWSVIRSLIYLSIFYVLKWIWFCQIGQKQDWPLVQLYIATSSNRPLI